MKDNKSTAKVKGTVLFTVVSVLMVLIVFLMGTLALAATASNRAYTNYQKEQTEYTARLLLDSVVEAINRDTAATGIKSQMVNLSTRGSDMEVKVELEGTEHTVRITNVGKQTLYNEVKSAWVEGVVYEVAAVNAKLLADTTYCAYIIGEHDVVTRTNGGGGAFVSMGDIGGQDNEVGTGGFITGGTYIGVGIDPEDYSLGKYGETIIDAPFYVKGNVTATNEVYFHFTAPGDSFVVTGDYAASGQGGLIPVFDGFHWDPTLTNQSYEELPYFYVGGTLTLNSEKRGAGGAANVMGDDDYAVNIYCGELVVDSKVGLNLHGDLYCFDPNGVNKIGSDGSRSTLYNWAAQTLQKKDGSRTELGNFYSMGDVELGGPNPNHAIEIQGDLRVEKNVSITQGNVTVHGDLVCGGTLSNNRNLKVTGSIYASDINNSGKIDCDGQIIAYNVSNQGDTSGKTPTIQSTAGLTPTGSKRVWTEFTEFTVNEATNPRNFTYAYTEYVDENGLVTSQPYSGTVPHHDEYAISLHPNYLTFLETTDAEYQRIKNLYDNSGEANATTVDIFSISAAYGKDIYPIEFMQHMLLNSADGIVKEPVESDYTSAGYPIKVEELGPNIYDTGTAALKVPTYTAAQLEAAGYLNDGGTPGDRHDDYYEIDMSCELVGDFNGNIFVNSDSDPITVILNNVRMSQDGGGGKTQIIVDDSKQVTFFMRGTVTIDSGSIVTENYMDHFFGVGRWNYSTRTSGNLEGMISDLTIYQNANVGDWWYPNVIIFGEDGSVLDMSKNNSLVTAHIRAPKMTFKQKMGMQLGKQIEYIGSGTMLYGPQRGHGPGPGPGHRPNRVYSADANHIGVIGQLIAGQIIMSNDAKWGMLYVTDSGAGATCRCNCGSCTVTNPSTCTCNCGTPGCICTGATPMGAIPARFTTLYYNYY